jgi:ferredoxin-NADP reductase/predicted pyridoxine 5'-phosphate oxidase superfamily flavin-nucleotide-binding protein
MAHKFAEIAFTPTIREIQVAEGSRASYAPMDEGEDYNHELRDREASFIGARDSFYMASVSETGWPYVQHRGGPAGFMKVLDAHTLGFADYSGNRQYVSTGNFSRDNRVSLFFMDYPNRTRLKLLGRVRIVGHEQPEILERLEDPDYPAQVERAFVIEVEAFDWNCPQHITPRFSEVEIEQLLTELQEENRQLKAALSDASAANEARQGADTSTDPGSAPGDATEVLGEGPLALIVSGVRQLAPRIRAFELRDPDGANLPPVEPGSHLRVPVRLPNGEVVDRHYSIASDPARRDLYEIAVLREEQGSGGSAAVHSGYQLGTRLNVDMPRNHFALHEDERPALLIAGGIGITAIRSLSQALAERGTAFEMHYASRSQRDMAFRDQLNSELPGRLNLYSSEEGERLDVAATLASAPDDTVIYVCGPQRLNQAVRDTAKTLGIARDRVRLELFN